MIKRIKDHYFTSKSYGLIYTHHFFHNISLSIMYVFTGAYFLKLGLPLPFVLLFYGVEFGVRGFLCPLALSLANRIGLVKSQILSSVFFILFFYGISLADQNIWIGFFSLFFAAIAGAIYYPFSDILEALYIEENHNRTKQLSMSLIAGSLGNVVGAAGFGFLLSHFGFDAVLYLASISFILSIVPLLALQDNTKPDALFTKPAEVYKFLADKEFIALWKPFFGEQLIIIVKIVMVPIFIYTVVGTLDSLGYLIAMALIAEKILTLMAGHITDKKGIAKTLRISAFTYPLAMAAYILFAKTPLSVFIIESYHRTAANIYQTTFRSAIHRFARENYPRQMQLFGTAWQMALCFGELLVLPLYALLACFIGINIFYIACGFAILGVWLINDYFSKNKHKPKDQA